MEKVKLLKDMGIHKEGDVIEISSEYVAGLIKSGSVRKIGTVKKIISKRLNK